MKNNSCKTVICTLSRSPISGSWFTVVPTSVMNFTILLACMYVAKVDDRGKASCVYMFDEQLINFDDVFSKSYFMDKSSEKQEIVDFSHRWNHDHKNVIYKNGFHKKIISFSLALTLIFSSLLFSPKFHNSLQVEATTYGN